MRTTFIVGFPGETDAEFEELRQFVADVRFERVGVFPYSLEPGTPAEKLDGHLPEEVKQARVDAMMEVQQEVAFGWAAAQVGKEHPVVIDGPGPGVRQPRPRPDVRRRAGHRLRRAGEGEEPAAGRLRAGQGHRGRRLRPGRPGGRPAVVSDEQPLRSAALAQRPKPTLARSHSAGGGAVRLHRPPTLARRPHLVRRGLCDRLARRLVGAALRTADARRPQSRSARRQGPRLRRVHLPHPG